MRRVLIPSDNVDFVVNWAEAYARLGWHVTVGAFNFSLRQGGFDLVHLLWPEELSGWRVPTDRQLAELTKTLDWWNASCRTMISVQNLYPHGHFRNEKYRALFDAIYSRCRVITHFSSISVELVKAEFSGAAGNAHHLVTTPFNYDRLLPPTRDKIASRRSFGFKPEEFVVLSFGSLRNWDEVQLIRDAFNEANIPTKRLLMAGRYNEPGPPWRQRLRRIKWRLWLRDPRMKAIAQYIADEDVYRYFDAADVVIIPRFRNELSSGLQGLGMTFGTMIVAPNAGAFPDYLKGSSNLLYEAANAKSLARSLEQAAHADREQISQENRRIADTWSWDGIVRSSVDAVDRVASGSGVDGGTSL